MIKLDGLLNILRHLDYILVFCGEPISLGSKYLAHSNELLDIFGEANLTLPLGHV